MSSQTPRPLPLNPTKAHTCVFSLSLPVSLVCGPRCAVWFPGLLNNKPLFFQSSPLVIAEGHLAITKNHKGWSSHNIGYWWAEMHQNTQCAMPTHGEIWGEKDHENKGRFGTRLPDFIAFHREAFSATVRQVLLWAKTSWLAQSPDDGWHF